MVLSGAAKHVHYRRRGEVTKMLLPALPSGAANWAGARGGGIE